jgi:cytochrome c oxidase subunit IV
MNAVSSQPVPERDDAVDAHAVRYARSRRRCVAACAALLALLAASAALGRLHLGVGNLFAGAGIAVVKAAIVAYVFMSLREASPLTRTVAAAGVAALLVLGLLSLVDFLPRHDEAAELQQPQWVRPAFAQFHPPTADPAPLKGVSP